MTGTIKGHCFTNIDNLKRESWPTVFSCKPERGDRVQSASGKSILRVVSVTHTTNKDGEPELKVELHIIR